jgi:ketosteroid isomerase-like protein
MSAKDVVKTWVNAFNRADVDALTELYQEDAVNHQVANDPIEGCEAIRDTFRRVCVSEDDVRGGEPIRRRRVGDPRMARSSGSAWLRFFRVIDGKIAFQRGYWDKLSFLRQHGFPVPDTAR